MNFFVDGSAAFGGIKPLAPATRQKAGKGLSREKQSPTKKFARRRWLRINYNKCAHKLCASFINCYAYKTCVGGSMATEEKGDKKRVNLYLDEKTVENAKSLGINLSQVTTEILDVLSVPHTNTLKARMELYEVIKPILKKKKVGLTIGTLYEEGGGEVRLKLYGKGIFIQADYGEYIPDFLPEKNVDGIEYEDNKDMEIVTWTVNNLDKVLELAWASHMLTPEELLSELLSTLAKEAAERKKEVENIEKIKRLIQAIEPDLLSEK